MNGKKHGKYRIYMDTSKKQILLQIQIRNEMKNNIKREQMELKKWSVYLIAQADKIGKPKRQKKNAELETDGEDKINKISRKNFYSPLSIEGYDFTEEPILSGNINEETFLLVKFENK